MCSAARPVRRRYSSVRSSIGKIAHVEPNSGDMLPIVVRSATGNDESPLPKNSTNLPTTPFLRSISVIVSTRSVAVTPSRSLPSRRKPMTSGISIVTGCPSIAASASMPPTPHAKHADAVDHRRMRIGADRGIGIRESRSSASNATPAPPPPKTTRARYSMLT